MIFFTADTHFNHANIIKYTKRPFSNVEEMNSTLISNWNSVVRKNDTVYHLGDFCFGNPDRFIRSLNGTIHFVLGNHDKDILRRVSPTIPYKRVVSINGQCIVLSHFAMRVWDKSHFNRSIHLFGHSHGKLEPYNKSVDVGIDSSWITNNIEYRPFSITQILNFMENR